MTITPGEYTLKVNGLDLRYKVAGNGPGTGATAPGARRDV